MGEHTRRAVGDASIAHGLGVPAAVLAAVCLPTPPSMTSQPSSAREEPVPPPGTRQPTALPALAVRDNFGRPLEPKGNHVLHGAGQRGWEFASYWYAVGRNKPLVSKRYLHLRERPAAIRKHLRELAYEMQSYGRRRLILELSISMAKGVAAGTDLCAEVAEGKRDAELDAFAEGLAAYEGAPVFVRLGYEFNGHWNGYRAESYVEAWHRARARIPAKGAANLAWVWCYIPAGASLEYRAFYPGDACVDWWGIDLFKRSQIDRAEAREFLQEARRRRYPVIISESTPQGIGVHDADKAWSEFFLPYVRLIADQPNVKAFCYINRDWTLWAKYPGWEDARLDRNADLLRRWQQVLARPEFLHAAAADDQTILHLPAPNRPGGGADNAAPP